MRADLAVLYEHPQWQKPLFQALERRGVRYVPVDLEQVAFSDTDEPLAPLYLNQASRSAYVRGNARAVPYALAYLLAPQLRRALLLQEYFPTDPAKGIVRMEFLGGELLYAMRVVSHGRFNLCPSPVCNPEDRDAARPVEFYPYPEVPASAVHTGRRIVAGGRLDV